MSTTAPDDERAFQRRLALIQIWYGGIITLGATTFAIGATMWVATWSFFPALMVKENEVFILGIINMFNTLGPLFMIVGIITIIGGFIPPLLRLR